LHLHPILYGIMKSRICIRLLGFLCSLDQICFLKNDMFPVQVDPDPSDRIMAYLPPSWMFWTIFTIIIFRSSEHTILGQNLSDLFPSALVEHFRVSIRVVVIIMFISILYFSIFLHYVVVSVVCLLENCNSHLKVKVHMQCVSVFTGSLFVLDHRHSCIIIVW
jgi:hypothetical protein